MEEEEGRREEEGGRDEEEGIRDEEGGRREEVMVLLLFKCFFTCTCGTINGGHDDQELWSSGDFASSPPPAACFQTLLGLCLRLPRI